MKFYFSTINLGCSKNQVDLEYIIWELLGIGTDNNGLDIRFFDNPLDDKVEYIIINTCWFLSSSRDEAEWTIEDYDDLWKKIIITWCYVPVRDDNFLKWLKNLYKVFPIEDSENISKKILDFKEKRLESYLDKIDRLNDKKKAFIWSGKKTRFPFNSPYGYEYVKIAEWCDNRCSFCIIPKIRWKQTSRPIEDIIREIINLVNLWVKEIEIIAQDTTRYGTDLYWESRLFELLEEIEKLPLDFKFRLFYLYPDILTLDNIKNLKNFKKFIPYFDLPVQHISPKILKLMGRFYDDNHIFALLDFIKKEFKDAFLHTNFIIWFPSEWEKEFDELVNFSQKYEFDSVSLFGYHDESLAWSSKLSDKVEEKIIRDRVEKLSKVLKVIYDKKDNSRKWKKLIWYIQDFDDKKVYVRREYKAPEIDELDIISTKDIISWNIEIWEKIVYQYKK